MIVGIDFDNTIASYDDSMHRWAVERGLIPPELPKNKKAIRDALRSLPDGEAKWRALQVSSYGPGMSEARPMAGVKELVAACKARGIEVWIVSHKTEHANFGDPTVNLRAAALGWLQAQGFVDSPQHGIGQERIFFESTREEKVARIRALGITHFVDDLVETFLESSFPAEVEQILFCPHGALDADQRWCAFADWYAIHEHLLGNSGRSVHDDHAAIAAQLGRPVDSVERIGAGRNSRVYRVRCGADTYAAKFYFRPTADGLDRLQVELSALGFLWRRGVRDIAEPVSADFVRQLALYRYLEGTPIAAGGASAEDVTQLTAFLQVLKGIAADAEALSLANAAEAFFTPQAIVGSIDRRLATLAALELRGPVYDALRRFLDDELAPALRLFGDRATAVAHGEVPREHRTLSPSDFGFHNALRRPDGRLAFVDFEYFGWDDPVKTLSDCMLHPQMCLTEERKVQLAHELDRIFGADPRWRARVHELFPLFALKWCMIMLNEFRPEQVERRRYVDGDAEEIAVIQMRQLEAARALLSRTVRERGAFPYWGPVS